MLAPRRELWLELGLVSKLVHRLALVPGPERELVAAQLVAVMHHLVMLVQLVLALLPGQWCCCCQL